jgi:hypothetical protein
MSHSFLVRSKEKNDNKKKGLNDALSQEAPQTHQVQAATNNKGKPSTMDDTTFESLQHTFCQ